jgi:hypothetical protein
MFSMGASAVFACDVGSVSTAELDVLTTLLRDGLAGRQLSSEFRRHRLWLVAASQQMEPVFECKTRARHH